MPFNSFLFVFGFLPGVLLVYYLCAATGSNRLRLLSICALTLVFYGVSASNYVVLLLGSIIFNFFAARWIARLDGRVKSAVLTFGVCSNVGLLIYFKYTNFLLDNLSSVLGANTSISNIALPLAISFFTFQQIAFLVDTARGLVVPSRPLTYASSILFFPYIISGPITLYREVSEQLERPVAFKDVPGNMVIGLSMFAIGLFKKTVIADTFALWVDPAFAGASNGALIGALGAWGMTLAYLLQMYFDFSGYSDMAIGLGRMLGIVLPLNFFSPLRCTSIIDWWRRWHMTLGRFVGAYIFQPIALALSRWAAMRKLRRWPMFSVGTLVPTFITMMVIGVWHGGNWTFFMFGALHGLYMVINEAWRAYTKKKRGQKSRSLPPMLGNALTVLAVLVALVPFRAPDATTAIYLWKCMVGLNGWGGGLPNMPVAGDVGGLALFAMIVAAMISLYALPNTQQLMRSYNPALEWGKWISVSPARFDFKWRANLAWSAATGVVLLLGIAFVGRGTSSFVYFGF